MLISVCESFCALKANAWLSNTSMCTTINEAFRDFSGLLRCLAAVIRELKCQCETHRSAVRIFQPAVVPQLHTSFNTHVLYRVRRSHLWRDAKQNFPNMKHYIPNTVSLVNMFSWVLWKFRTQTLVLCFSPTLVQILLTAHENNVALATPTQRTFTTIIMCSPSGFSSGATVITFLLLSSTQRLQAKSCFFLKSLH